MPKIKLATQVALSALLVAAGMTTVVATRQKMGSKPKSDSITAVLSGKITFPLAPENISTIPLYHVNRNLWGTLLDGHGKPILARLFDVSADGKTFQFDMLPTARFSNGRRITSGDVKFSFDRLMTKQAPGHFSAKNLIHSIKVLSPSRFDIELKENGAVFPFLLSTPEMGIVPKEDCDSGGVVASLAVTSGPYVLEGAAESDRLILHKNKYFSGIQDRAPKKVVLLFRNGINSLTESLTNDSADFAEFYTFVSPQILSEIRANHDFGTTVTRPSFSVFMSANTRTLSSPQRKSIAAILREKLAHLLSPELEQRSFQILPPGTFGSLNENFIPGIGYDSYNSDLPNKVRIASYDKTGPLQDAVVAVLNASGIRSEIVPFGKGFDFDLAFLGQGMNTDYPEIEFYLSMMSQWAFISATPHEKDLIMETIHSSDRATRSRNIQTISKALLSDARVIPLVVRSYLHVYRKSRLDVDQASSYDGEVPFWKMKVLSE